MFFGLVPYSNGCSLFIFLKTPIRARGLHQSPRLLGVREVGKKAIAGDERRVDLLRLIAQAQALERMERPAPAGLRLSDPPRRTVTTFGRLADTFSQSLL